MVADCEVLILDQKNILDQAGEREELAASNEQTSHETDEFGVDQETN